MPPNDLLPKSAVFNYFKRWRDDGTWQAIVELPKRPVVEWRDAARRVRFAATSTLT